MINRDYSSDIKALKKLGFLILNVLGAIWTAMVWITKKIIVPTLKWLWEKMRKYPVFFFVVLPIILLTIFFLEVMKIVIGVAVLLFIIFFGIGSSNGSTIKTFAWTYFLFGGGSRND